MFEYEENYSLSSDIMEEKLHNLFVVYNDNMLKNIRLRLNPKSNQSQLQAEQGGKGNRETFRTGGVSPPPTEPRKEHLYKSATSPT